MSFIFAPEVEHESTGLATLRRHGFRDAETDPDCGMFVRPTARAGGPFVVASGDSAGLQCALEDAPSEPTPAPRIPPPAPVDRTTAPPETRRTELAAAPQETVAPTRPPARRTVLVVDDETLVRQFVQQLLRRRGLVTLEAVNGLDALMRYRENAGAIGLVVTDIYMPSMDGLELVRALRREPNPPALAVMSGRLDDAARATLHEEGVRCVLNKPFPLEEIDGLVALVPV